MNVNSQIKLNQRWRGHDPIIRPHARNTTGLATTRF